MLEPADEDLLSAALRHVRDAEHLASPGPGQSVDQAFHLAGFGPECARKAALSKRTYDQAIGHGVTQWSERALSFALAADPAAHRYDLADWAKDYPALKAWTEQSRYKRTGACTVQVVATLLHEARSLVDRIVFALWADGKVPGGFAW
jgi:hypothetical protein